MRYNVKVLWNSGKEQVKQFAYLDEAKRYAQSTIHPMNVCIITKIK